MPAYGYVILALGWLVWVVPFLLKGPPKQAPERIDRRARWGILVQAVAYTLLWQSEFWNRPPATWHVGLAVLFFATGALLAWTGRRALGQQWRLDAGLNRDHQLVRSGPYRVVRHPIYTSMLCLLLGTGLIITPWPMLLVSVALLILGLEIRVHVEDALLRDRFGPEFQDYRRAVPAYIPFIR
jgi:protein-S-isoprenylcysteine O-methyltransferase Ste14